MKCRRRARSNGPSRSGDNSKYKGAEWRRNYLILGSHSSGRRTLEAAGPADKTSTKAASHDRAGSAAKGKEVFRQEMRLCHFGYSDLKEDWAWPQGNSKAGEFLVKRQQGHHDSLKPDRKTATRRCRPSRCAGACANQGRGCVRQDSLRLGKRKSPRDPDCSSPGAKFNMKLRLLQYSVFERLGWAQDGLLSSP